jgi:hypothetical protein
MFKHHLNSNFNFLVKYCILIDLQDSNVSSLVVAHISNPFVPYVDVSYIVGVSKVLRPKLEAH